ncbi:uncharacterized protein LOC119179773 isoform X2 [Rhipicephalus microplus]|uniref:uncharacterized protein LOC119179773 isoform X2 n=1 Tax=Rhipicephalus microplus TaxID=6941 RepID=UPI003F6C2127
MFLCTCAHADMMPQTQRGGEASCAVGKLAASQNAWPRRKIIFLTGPALRCAVLCIRPQLSSLCRP